MKLKQSIDYLLAKSIIAFKFKHRLIEACLTSLVTGKTACLLPNSSVKMQKDYSCTYLDIYLVFICVNDYFN